MLSPNLKQLSGLISTQKHAGSVSEKWREKNTNDDIRAWVEKSGEKGEFFFGGRKILLGCSCSFVKGN